MRLGTFSARGQVKGIVAKGGFLAVTFQFEGAERNHPMPMIFRNQEISDTERDPELLFPESTELVLNRTIDIQVSVCAVDRSKRKEYASDKPQRWQELILFARVAEPVPVADQGANGARAAAPATAGK